MKQTVRTFFSLYKKGALQKRLLARRKNFRRGPRPVPRKSAGRPPKNIFGGRPADPRGTGRSPRVSARNRGGRSSAEPIAPKEARPLLGTLPQKISSGATPLAPPLNGIRSTFLASPAHISIGQGGADQPAVTN